MGTMLCDDRDRLMSLRIVGATRSWEKRGLGKILFFQKDQPCRHLDLGLLAS